MALGGEMTDSSLVIDTIVVASVVLMAVAALSVQRRRLQRRLYSDAQRAVMIDRETFPLCDAVWAVGTSAGSRLVLDSLQHSRARTAEGIWADLAINVGKLSEADRVRAMASKQSYVRARVDRELWDKHTDLVDRAVAVGGLDALVLALGQRPEWVEAVYEKAIDLDALTGFALGRLPGIEFAPDAWVEELQRTGGQIVEPIAELAGEGLTNALAAIGDSHLPLLTISRALVKGRVASEAGLNGERVAENIAWDIGATGGSVMAGAALGTAIFPVVGTIVGGLIGGLFGAGVAEEGKRRHFSSAYQSASDEYKRIGDLVDSQHWRGLSGGMELTAERATDVLTQLEADLRRWRSPIIRPSLERAVLSATVDAGHQWLHAWKSDLAQWQAELDATAGHDWAVGRGAFVIGRRDLIIECGLDEADIESALQASAFVDEERQKLLLA